MHRLLVGYRPSRRTPSAHAQPLCLALNSLLSRNVHFKNTWSSLAQSLQAQPEATDLLSLERVVVQELAGRCRHVYTHDSRFFLHRLHFGELLRETTQKE